MLRDNTASFVLPPRGIVFVREVLCFFSAKDAFETRSC